MKFWLLTHKLGSWNFSVNPLISSLERDILFWWERESCRVRAKREENKNKEKGVGKEGLDFLIRCSQGNTIREKTFEAAKGDKRCGLWVEYVGCLGKISPPTFSTFIFLCIHTYTFLQIITSLCIYIYIYIYILTFIKLYP